MNRQKEDMKKSWVALVERKLVEAGNDEELAKNLVRKHMMNNPTLAERYAPIWRDDSVKAWCEIIARDDKGEPIQ